MEVAEIRGADSLQVRMEERVGMGIAPPKLERWLGVVGHRFGVWSRMITFPLGDLRSSWQIRS